MRNHNGYPKCPRCESILPGGITHDSLTECVSTLRSRLAIKDSELSDAKRRADNLAARVDSWKAKAQVARTPEAYVSAGKRIDRLETRTAALTAQLKAVDERCRAAEQRAKFAVNQVAFLQDQRRIA